MKALDHAVGREYVKNDYLKLFIVKIGHLGLVLFNFGGATVKKMGS